MGPHGMRSHSLAGAALNNLGVARHVHEVALYGERGPLWVTLHRAIIEYAGQQAPALAVDERAGRLEDVADDGSDQ